MSSIGCAITALMKRAVYGKRGTVTVGTGTYMTLPGTQRTPKKGAKKVAEEAERANQEAAQAAEEAEKVASLATESNLRLQGENDALRAQLVEAEVKKKDQDSELKAKLVETAKFEDAYRDWITELMDENEALAKRVAEAEACPGAARNGWRLSL